MKKGSCGCGGAPVGECFSCECDVCVAPTSTQGAWFDMGGFWLCISCYTAMGFAEGTPLIDVRVG